jgi:ABC-2 type transport system permease protein
VIDWLTGIAKSLIRTSAFLPKESLELLRQPSLLLSLVIGPFIILAFFGISTSPTRPPAATMLVVPPESPFAADPQRLVGELGPAVNLVGITNNIDQARADLLAGRADLIVELPEDVETPLRQGQRATVRLYYNAVDPVEIAYTEFVSYTLISELNRRVLTMVAAETQRELEDAQRFAQTAQEYMDVLEANPAMRQAAGVSEPEFQRARVMANELETLAQQIEQAPPEVLASPFESNVENTAVFEPTFVAFYGPAVLALLLQHIAVSFTALSLVRERILGTTELFRVSPLTSGEILVSKYLSYLLVTMLIALLLAVLMVRVLGIPLIGPPMVLVGALLLLVLASLGIGFLISVVSSTEREAVQFAMLVLIAAVFFCGILFPLEQILFPARAIALALPATYGVRAFQGVMLEGETVANDLIVLGAMGVILFGLALVIYGRQFRAESVE